MAEHEATVSHAPLTEATVRAVTERRRGLSSLLDAAATPEERWSLYPALAYRRNPDAECVTGTLGRGVLLRVGGGT